MLGHPGPEGPKQRPPLGRRRRRHRLRDHAVLAEKPEEPGGGRKGLPVRSTGVSHTRLFREGNLARFEPLDQIVCGEPCSAQPIGPPSQRAQRMLDPDRPVALLVEPRGKGIDVGGGRASAEPLSSDRRVQMSFEHRDLPSVRVVRIGPPVCRAISGRCTRPGTRLRPRRGSRAAYDGEAEPATRPPEARITRCLLTVRKIDSRRRAERGRVNS